MMGSYAVPKAKKPQFFSLATPVGMSGTFDKFGIHINPVELTATTVSFLTSPLHVPVRSLFSGDVEVDGEKACKIAWQSVNANTLPGPEGSKGAAPAAAKPAAEKPIDEAVGIPDTMSF